jgi:hypothetical protein
MYSPSELSSYYERRKSNFGVLAALLRLGTKYEVNHFKQTAYRVIASVFPTTLKEWDHRDLSLIQRFHGQSFAVVKLGRDTGLMTLLPAALCASCCTPNGTTDILNGRLSSKHAHRAELDMPDKEICLKAREALHTALREKILNALLLKGQKCQTPEHCNAQRLESVRNLIDGKMMGDPLQHIFDVKFQTLLRFSASLCKACLAMSEWNFAIARRNLWLELPSFFGLPSWADLRKSLQSHGLQDGKANSEWVIREPFIGFCCE